ncbi:TIGR03086 family metal-binding protein [Allosalinactinospora lopnorensis]|uniref:TIGR03086 family metal-binding protein n=1 Tax=Allosalinactinospora lopnorensis TaxID=1352348 RepID=UPI000623C600|nr:TIGR03086 family metal-binding protein [Allosalinactinospora lopnorensis]
MTEISERYARLGDGFAAAIAAVPADRWESASPCEGWTARDVVRHVIETQGMFLGLVGRELGPVPPVADDPAAAWDAARKVVQADLDDPVRAGAEFDGLWGRTRFADAVDAFLCFDLVVHRWDLARATGLDERLDPADVRWAAEQTSRFGDGLRRDGVCGPALTPPEGADEQTRLLVFLGRRAW